MGFASAERVGQGGVGWFTHTVLCTWWLLGLAIKGPWLALVNSHTDCMNRLRKCLLSPFRGFISGREGFLGSEWVFAK